MNLEFRLRYLVRFGKKLGLVALIFLSFPVSIVKAQIEPDGSLPTNVEQLRDLLMEITGGEIAGDNLFHSFDEFSVPNGMEAVFKNPSNIENIFARVTGGDISQIDGILSTQGTANLFLINPAGIVFGENASLNIGGSFIGTTADSVVFDDGKEFAASDSSDPLLSVEVPVGLGFSSNSGSIAVNGNGDQNITASPLEPTEVKVNEPGLSVASGETLGLFGSDVTIDGSILEAEGGDITLSSVDSGLIDIQQTSDAIAFASKNVDTFQDITLKNFSLINANSQGEESITLTGKNINLLDGSFIVTQGQDNFATSALTLQASDTLRLAGTSPDGQASSSIRSEVLQSGELAAGDIAISADKLVIEDAGRVQTATYSQSENAVGGNIMVRGSNAININNGFIASTTFGNAQAGNLNIDTSQLELTDFGTITSSAFLTGNGGDVLINADDIKVIGVSEPSIERTTISASSFSSSQTGGNAGNIILNTDRLSVTQGASVSSSSFASGDAGGVTVNASEQVEVSGKNEQFLGSSPQSTIRTAVRATTQTGQQTPGFPDVPSGDAGTLSINTSSLKINDEATVGVENQGSGKAGTLDLKAENIALDEASRVTASSASGQGGDINLDTDNLQLDTNSEITAEAGQQGDGGNITINASNILAKKSSAVTADAEGGDGGNLDIDAVNLFLEAPIDEIFSASSELGIDGTIEIEANQDFEGSFDLITPDFEVAEKALQGSCFTSRNSQQDSFVYGGTGGLPVSPDSMIEEEESASSRLSQVKPGLPQPNPLETKPDYMYPEDYEWQPGDPIIEPTDLIKTKDGRLLWVNRHVSKDDLVCQ